MSKKIALAFVSALALACAGCVTAQSLRSQASKCCEAGVEISGVMPEPYILTPGSCYTITTSDCVDTALIDVEPVWPGGPNQPTPFQIETVDTRGGQRFCLPSGLPAGDYRLTATLIPACAGQPVTLAPVVYVVGN